jgi:putative transposase
MVFHVLNRGNGRMRIFQKEGDYLAFEKVLAETLKIVPLRLLG